MIEIKEICVKKPRIYVAYWTKLRLAKRKSMKDLHPSLFLPRISLKDAGLMEDALSTVVLPAKIFIDQVEDECCHITRPQVVTSLSGSTISSTVQTRSEKETPQGSVYSEKTRSVQNQIIINPQQEEGKVENEFCSITPPRVGTSLSGSTISSTVQARLEKKTPRF